MDKINIKNIDMEGVNLITPNSFKDDRGSFSRVFCKKELTPLETSFVQINHSVTKQKGTVRGLHFQYPPYSEIKMVKCIKGKVLDVIVDLRKNSPTFLQKHYEELSDKNMNMIYIPKGFAHGFQTLEDDTELLYFHSEFYTDKKEGSLNIFDPILDIKLPLEISNISDKDKNNSFIDKNFEGIEI